MCYNYNSVILLRGMGMLKFVENRRAQRLDIDMSIALYDINSESSADSAETFPVEVENISMTGIGFTTNCPIDVHTFYKACLDFPTKDSMNVIIEVVRSQDKDNGEHMYGGSFVGISEADKFKIEVFRLFEENRRQVK